MDSIIVLVYSVFLSLTNSFNEKISIIVVNNMFLIFAGVNINLSNIVIIQAISKLFRDIFCDSL